MTFGNSDTKQNSREGEDEEKKTAIPGETDDRIVQPIHYQAANLADLVLTARKRDQVLTLWSASIAGDEMKKWQIALLVLPGWNASGLVVGAITSGFTRQGDQKYNSTTHEITYENARSGCVYRSLSSFMNPGFVVGCELFRKRFEIEGISRIGEVTK